jgi:putative transposase
MEIQKKEILSFVESERQKGRILSDILKHLQIPRSNYYRWAKRASVLPTSVTKSRATAKTVTEVELCRIDTMKAQHPEMRHRQIQGMLQLEGHYLSATSVYRRLKSQGLVEHYERRAAPWDEPLYEVIGANMMWGADWTQLRIGGRRWYLLNLIDFYSRFVVHFEIVDNVCARHITELYEMGLATLNIGLDHWSKPELRLDQGSPNTARVTREFFKDIKADLSFARIRRPTDNARTERFYRTIKQEEIYIVGDYQDELTARETIGEYIKWYNEKRPHQALWNYTPLLVHQTNNKTYLRNALKQLKRKTWEDRKEYWLEAKKILLTNN